MLNYRKHSRQKMPMQSRCIRRSESREDAVDIAIEADTFAVTASLGKLIT